MVRIALTTAAAVGVATTLALAGCTANRAPAGTTSTTTPQSTSPPPTSRPTTTTTTSIDPVLARIPEAARPNTQAGAEAFARFFYAQVAAAWVNADPSLLDGLYESGCKACNSYRQSADQLRSANLHHESPALTVKGSSANVFDNGRVEVAVPVVQNAVDVIDARGTRVRVTRPDNGTFVLTLGWVGRWVVRRAQVEQVS